MTPRSILVLGLLLAALPAASASRFYSDDPADLWNRVHDALLARTNSAGAVYRDLLDPPLWFRTKHLVDDASCQRVTKLLRDFSGDDSALASKTPLRRAIMQRDLLGVFSWLIDGHRGGSGRLMQPQREFARALARAIEHVALGESAIRKLPANFTTSPDFPAAFDPAQPSRPFLSPDLFTENSPWIALEPHGDDWLPATVHFKFFRGRSAFEVRFFHPGGRAAGEAYLRDLAAFPKPLVYENPKRNKNPDETGPWLNPQTPVFPTNSAWALIRRAILADREGRPVLSPLVESVQIRVYRQNDRPASRPVTVTKSGYLEGDVESQAFFEWHFSRDFLNGRPGLRPSDPVLSMYAHHFMSKQFDPFEEGWNLPEPGSSRARLECHVCHADSGLASVNSRTRRFETGELMRPPELKPVSFARIAQITELEAAQLQLWQVLPWLQHAD